MSTRTLHAIGNAHIDPVWLWRWPEGLETIRATFRSALDRMAEYPGFIFTCSSSAFYAMLEDTDPQMVDEIAERVREGRWELVGGWWVEPDANVPGGEGLLRQGLYGQAYLRERFGSQATIGYNPDTFGHPGTLPQILRLLGLRGYVFLRPGPHEKALPGPVFRWRSPDGSEVIACRIAHAYCTWPEQIGEHIRRSAEAAPPDPLDYVAFYGVGNHGGGPTRANIESIAAHPDADSAMKVQLSSLGRFFDSLDADRAAGVELPVVAEELQYHARGCYAAVSDIKHHNRRVEHLLLSAERMASCAAHLVGKVYPADALRAAWKALLFTQFHDILAGTSLPEAYQDARDAQGYAAHIAASTLHASAQAITGKVATQGPGNALVVVNTLPWTVKVPIEVERGAPNIADADGTPIAAQAVQPTTVSGQRRSCFVAELPGLGYRVLREAEDPMPLAPPTVPLAVGPDSIENAWWRLTVAVETGCIGALRDLAIGADVLDDGGMALVVVDDPSDTWSHDVARFDVEMGRFRGSEVVVEETGPVRACLRTVAAWDSCTAVHRIRVYRELPIIEGEIRLHWIGGRKALKLALPLAVDDGTATYEVAYGCCERPADGSEQPAQQWADLTGHLRTAGQPAPVYGVALLNDGKYGYDARPSELRMTLLRSPVFAHHDPSKLDPSGDYRYTDQGEQVVRYRLVPHVGPACAQALARRAMELNVAPITVNEFQHGGPLPAACAFAQVEPEAIVATVCKEAEDGDGLIFRAYESVGQRVTATITMPVLGLTWQPEFRPMQIRTWRVRPGHATPITEVDALEAA